MRVLTRARRLVAAAGATAGLAAVGLPAAHAASQPPDVWAGYESPVLAPGTPGKVIEQRIVGDAAGVATLTGVTVVYDVTGLAGVATLTPQSGKCATSGRLITCHVGSITTSVLNGPGQANPYMGDEYLPVKLVSVAGAVAGANGSFTVAVSATGATGSSPSAMTVTLADGPDLQVKGAGVGFLTSVPVSPASAYYRSVKFTNVGDQAAQGVTVEIYSDGHGVDVPELHKNCQYSAPTTAFCYIPDLVAPGATETLSPSVEVLTTTDLMWQGLSITVVPGYASLPNYSVGVGKPFTLVDASGAAQKPVSGQAAQTNLEYADSTVQTTLRVAGATADLAATVSVPPGPVYGQWQVDPVPFNYGPGFIELGRSGNYLVTGDVVFPAGVTVVSVPNGWQQVANSTPGVTEYLFYDGIEVAPNDGVYFAGSAVVQPQPGFTGGNGTFTVGLNGQPPSTAAGMYMGNIDTNTSNDTATFAIPAYGS